jgi:hypothetical protein
VVGHDAVRHHFDLEPGRRTQQFHHHRARDIYLRKCGIAAAGVDSGEEGREVEIVKTADMGVESHGWCRSPAKHCPT